MEEALLLTSESYFSSDPSAWLPLRQATCFICRLPPPPSNFLSPPKTSFSMTRPLRGQGKAAERYEPGLDGLNGEFSRVPTCRSKTPAGNQHLHPCVYVSVTLPR